MYAVGREVRDPARAAARSRGALGLPAPALRTQLERKARSSFVRRWITPEQARAVSKLELAGVGVVNEPRRIVPVPHARRRAWSASRTSTATAHAASSSRRTPGCAARRGGCASSATAGRSCSRSPTTTRAARGRRRRAHARRRAPGRRRARARGRGRGDRRARRPRDRARPAHAARCSRSPNRPGFDPNRFRTHALRRDALERLPRRDGARLRDEGVPGRGRARAAACSARHDVIDCENGRFRVPGKTITDIHPYGALDAAGMLRVSCNIGAAKIGYPLGPRAHSDAAARVRLRRRRRAAASPTSRPALLRAWKDWRPVDHATISFGQGMASRPMQLATPSRCSRTAACWRAPRLVAARREPDGAWEHAPRVAAPRVLRRDGGEHGARHARDGRRPGGHRPRAPGCAASASPARPAPRRSSRRTARYSQPSLPARGSSAWRPPTRRAS